MEGINNKFKMYCFVSEIITSLSRFVLVNIVEKQNCELYRENYYGLQSLYFSIGHCCEIDCCTAGWSGPVIRCNEGGEPAASPRPELSDPSSHYCRVGSPATVIISSCSNLKLPRYLLLVPLLVAVCLRIQ